MTVSPTFGCLGLGMAQLGLSRGPTNRSGRTGNYRGAGFAQGARNGRKGWHGAAATLGRHSGGEMPAQTHSALPPMHSVDEARINPALQPEYKEELGALA
jgi:hypothetical protein